MLYWTVYFPNDDCVDGSDTHTLLTHLLAFFADQYKDISDDVDLSDRFYFSVDYNELKSRIPGFDVHLITNPEHTLQLCNLAISEVCYSIDRIMLKVLFKNEVELEKRIVRVSGYNKITPLKELKASIVQLSIDGSF
jgi:hypothetical protein